MSRGTLWAIVSDLHCGSTVGLIHERGVALDDGGHYTPSAEQRELWRLWLSYWDRVRQERKRGDRLIVALLGDLIDGDHHRTSQIVSRNTHATQYRIAIEALGTAMALRPDRIIVIRGTEAHVGASAETEEAIARELDAWTYDDSPIRSHWHLQVESDGVLLDLAHHGRIGQRPWTRLTGPTTLSAQIALAAARAGERIPDIAIRGHYHQVADTGDLAKPRVIQLPCWQLATSYVHRIAAGSVPDVGGVIIRTDSGGYNLKWEVAKWRKREPMTIR